MSCSSAYQATQALLASCKGPIRKYGTEISYVVANMSFDEEFVFSGRPGPSLDFWSDLIVPGSTSHLCAPWEPFRDRFGFFWVELLEDDILFLRPCRRRHGQPHPTGLSADGLFPSVWQPIQELIYGFLVIEGFHDIDFIFCPRFFDGAGEPQLLGLLVANGLISSGKSGGNLFAFYMKEIFQHFEFFFRPWSDFIFRYF